MFCWRKFQTKTNLKKENNCGWISGKSYNEGYNCRRIAEFQEGMRRRSDLTYDIIKEWVKKFYEEHGKYPTRASGSVVYAPKEEPLTWQGVSICLMDGFRGLPGGLSLSDFLNKEMGILTRKYASRITEADVLEWVEKFYDRYGYYPTSKSQEGVDCPSDYGKLRWSTVNELLKNGQRGLPGGATLRKFIESKCSRPLKHKCWYNKRGNGEINLSNVSDK